MSIKGVLRGTIAVAVAVGVGLVAWAAQSPGFNLGLGQIGNESAESGPGASSEAGDEAGAGSVGGSIGPDTRFYTAPNQPASLHIEELRGNGEDEAADLIERMIDVPTGIWLTDGSPGEVRDRVRSIVGRAADDGSVPVIVVYNVPGRDCAQYSKGGADTDDDYRAWIDAVAEGLGEAPAVVIVEPDGLALMPTDCGQPDTFGRVDLIRYAGETLSEDPAAKIYLDAGHLRWHATGEIAARLVQGGIENVDGFFQNVSNHQPTEQAVAWGRWVSKCIWYGTQGNPTAGAFSSCVSQYGPARIDDPGTWHLNDAWYDNLVGDVPADDLPHFVIDTSRNGQGPWTPPEGRFSDPQEWCNPPDRGLGIRPTAATGDPLIDAFLWIKVPGESDGECLRGTGGPEDPLRERVDPPAGTWFPEVALELARNANPPLEGS